MKSLKNLLLILIALGVLAILPERTNTDFQPRALILVIFPVMIIVLSWLYLRHVARNFSLISRELPTVCLENELITVHLKIRYNSQIPFDQAYLFDSFPAVDILSSPEVTIQHENLAADGTIKLSYQHRLNRGYGDFLIGPVEMVIKDPIGFFEKKLIFPLKTPLKVWLNPPPPEDLDLVKANAVTPMGDSRSSQSGHGMEFYGIKEYAAGDDIRAMSWLKTAQTGRPVIKQFERDTRPDVFVALHTDKQQLRGFGFGNTMKRLLRIAAAIIGETQQRGLPASIGLCIDDEAHYLKINASVPVYGFMTDLLGNLQPAGEGGLQQLIDLALRKAGPGSIVYFLSQTVHLQLDVLLHALLTLKARGAKVSFWAIDDSNLVRFSLEQENTISKEEFIACLQEMDLEFLLLPNKQNK